MMKLKVTTTCFIALTALAGSAAKPLSVVDRIATSDALPHQLVSLAWSNPAMRVMERNFSLSEVKGSLISSNDSRVVDPQLGRGTRQWAFDASSYVKAGRGATAWGAASYHNGKDYGVRWNETSEPSMVYPYLMADSIGGNIKLERYAFSGGYAAPLCDRINWGATMGYQAALYYRAVDPRPRNVTSNLQFSLGATYKPSSALTLGAAVGYAKYKQTNRVDFYSELGSGRILHLTGLVTDYTRFAGDSGNGLYSGNTWWASATATTAWGLMATINGSRYAFTNYLTDVNNLPLARATHNELRGEVAYLAPAGWAVVANVMASRRVGRENVFGDAASGVYPQIASRENFFQNRFNASITGLVPIAIGKVALRLKPAVSYLHHNEIYRTPACREMLGTLWAGTKATAQLRMRRVLVTVGVNYAYGANASHELRLSGVTSETQSLAALVEQRHEHLAANQSLAGAEGRVDVALTQKIVLRLGAEWQLTHFATGVNRNQAICSAGVVF